MNLDTQDQIISESGESIDRKELLAQQFDDMQADEQPEPKESESHASNGKFVAKKEAEPDEVSAAEEPVWKRPPSSWKRDYHEVWQTADPRLQEYAYKREEEMRAGIEPLRSKAQFADQINEAIQPYMSTIHGLGIDAPRAIKALMEADHALRFSPPEQKRAYFANLAKQYGIDLADAATASQGGPVDPNYYALQNELNSVRGEIMSFKQQQEQAENQALLGEINNFATKAEHFEEVRPTMIQLLQSGVAGTLEDAYEKALRLNDELFQRAQQRSQAEAEAAKRESANRAAKAAKAAAVSVKSSTPGTQTKTKAQDRRSMLLEQFDSMNERF
jgi:hypothetical protein